MIRLRPLLIAAVLTLSGCSSLLHSDAAALQLYVLQLPATASVPRTTTGPSLRIARPLPGPGLNTDRIALLRPENRLDYYAGSRWSAPLADVLSDLQLAAFRADSAWSAVADDRSSFNTDYLLQTSIERFAAEYPSESAPPRIRIDLHCLLIRRSDGTLLGRFEVSASETAQQNRMSSVMAAFSAAANRAVSSVAGQADQLLRSAKSPGSPTAR